MIWEYYWEGEALFENQATCNVEASSLATRGEEERPKQTYKPHGLAAADEL
jgi:hypothetical protein